MLCVWPRCVRESVRALPLCLPLSLSRETLVVTWNMLWPVGCVCGVALCSWCQSRSVWAWEYFLRTCDHAQDDAEHAQWERSEFSSTAFSFFCLSFSLSGGLRMLSCNYNSWCKPFPWRSRIAVADCERQVAVCCQHAPLPLPGRVRCVRREQHHEQPHYVFSCNIYGTHERVEAKFLYGRSQWAPRRRWQCPEPG